MSLKATSACPLGISPARLSAWRDQMLNPGESAQLQAHVQGCSACQETLAEFASIARTLRHADTQSADTGRLRQDSLWRNIRPLIVQGQGAIDMHISRRVAWSGIGAIAAVAVIIFLFLRVLEPQNPMLPNPNRAPIGTATTTSSTLTAMQAWGSHYAGTIPQGQSLTKAFIPTDIAPDGSFVVGYVLNSPTDASIDLLTTSTGKIQLLSKISSSYPLTDLSNFSSTAGAAIVTDGHLVAWIADDGLQIDALDLQTMQTKTLVPVTSDGHGGQLGFDSLFADQGVLYYQAQSTDYQGQGVSVSSTYVASTSLTSKTTKTIANGTLIQFSWPYLLYRASDGSFHLTNIQTGSEATLPSTPFALNNSLNPNFQIRGTTVYSVTTAIVQGNATNQIWALLHADQAGAQWQIAATFPLQGYISSGEATLVGVNDRLFVLSQGAGILSQTPPLLAWDRMQQRIIAIGTLPEGRGTAFVIRGEWMAWDTIDSSQYITLSIVDTSALPVSPPPA
jgi:hypothetical protein